MKILITGSTGMVGKNIVESQKFGSFDLYTPASKELDLRVYHDVEQYVREVKPDLIIHAAGHVGGIQANIKNPVRFLVDNLDMGRNIVLAARENQVFQLINLGSSCMYPKNAPNPLVEDQLLTGMLEPTNEGYALAKITVQRLCQYINQEDDRYQYKTLIPCNLYGPWDKFDPAASHLIPAVIHKIHQAKEQGLDEVTVWGSGNARREFMYVEDLVDCIYLAVEKFDSMPFVMNVGLGFDYSINEYYQAVARAIGYEGQFVHDLSKPEGMKQKLVDISLLQEWGWKASTSLQEGIKKTYDFYLSQEERT